MGASAAALVRKALEDKPSAEAKRRLEIARKKIESSTNVISGDHLRLRRAVQILEYIGNSEARRILDRATTLASNNEIRQDAKESFDRLQKKEANTSK